MPDLDVHLTEAQLQELVPLRLPGEWEYLIYEEPMTLVPREFSGWGYLHIPAPRSLRVFSIWVPAAYTKSGVIYRKALRSVKKKRVYQNGKLVARRCSSYREMKPVEDFYKIRRKASDGYDSYCKACNLSRHKRSRDRKRKSRPGVPITRKTPCHPPASSVQADPSI